MAAAPAIAKVAIGDEPVEVVPVDEIPLDEGVDLTSHVSDCPCGPHQTIWTRLPEGDLTVMTSSNFDVVEVTAMDGMFRSYIPGVRH